MVREYSDHREYVCLVWPHPLGIVYGSDRDYPRSQPASFVGVLHSIAEASFNRADTEAFRPTTCTLRSFERLLPIL